MSAGPSEKGTGSVSAGKKLAYGVGAVAENTMQNGVNTMANPFFNVALGVSPALLGIATCVFRIWDAVTDPVMGMISDRTESRFGRRAPYIVGGAALAGLLFALMWWCPRGMSPAFYFGWFTLISVLFYTAFTIFGVPFVALGYEMSPDYHERTRIMSYRTWFSSLGGICIQWLFWLTQRDCFEDTVDGMRWVGIGVGILLLVMGSAPGFFIKERKLTVEEVTHNRQNIKFSGLLKVFGVKPFRCILWTLTWAVIGMFLVITLGFYINVYYVFGGNLKAASMLLGASGTFYHCCCMASVPLISWVSGKLGKKVTLLIFMFIAVLANLAKWWCFTPANPWLQLLATGLIAPGLSAIWTLLASMTADVTDLDELENGTRREGSFGAFYGWTMKLGLAFCFLISGFILQWTGFDAKLGGAQPEGTLFAIRLLYTVVPAVGILIAMAVIARFPINQQKAAEIRKQLEARRGTAAVEKSK
jgi:GPH family glycoside/pentoside/hexuronide:cation symporter